MRPYLTFQLVAPLASFGEIASGERRGSAPRPTRSQLVGLLAAALGLRREEDQRLGALTRGYGFAAALLGGSRPLLDYHTVQTPKEPALKDFARQHGRRPATRGEQVRFAAARPDPRTVLATVLTRRDYWCDVAVLVAVWARPEAPETLQTLANALRYPGFVLCFGRKACALTLPSAPIIAEYEDAAAALSARRLAVPLWREAGQTVEKDEPMKPTVGAIGLDSDDPAVNLSAERRVRRDVSRHEKSWLFDTREEAVVGETHT